MEIGLLCLGSVRVNPLNSEKSFDCIYGSMTSHHIYDTPRYGNMGLFSGKKRVINSNFNFSDFLIISCRHEVFGVRVIQILIMST